MEVETDLNEKLPGRSGQSFFRSPFQGALHAFVSVPCRVRDDFIRGGLWAADASS
jgi:hypothetical protein